MHLSASNATESPRAVDSPPKMNGELPNTNDTPITTLAGIFSLSDLLPELPLPAPQPETLNNRSLLFHPRVAEEARRLLTMRHHALVPQLAQALALTSTHDIELKEGSSGGMGCTGSTVLPPATAPELLEALRQLNSELFVERAAPKRAASPSPTQTTSLAAPAAESSTPANGLTQPPPETTVAPALASPPLPSVIPASEHRQSPLTISQSAVPEPTPSVPAPAPVETETSVPMHQPTQPIPTTEQPSSAPVPVVADPTATVTTSILPSSAATAPTAAPPLQVSPSTATSASDRVAPPVDTTATPADVVVPQQPVVADVPVPGSPPTVAAPSVSELPTTPVSNAVAASTATPDLKQELLTPGSATADGDLATSRFNALRDSTATRKIKVVVKTDPENERLMQKALADMARSKAAVSRKLSFVPGDGSDDNDADGSGKPRNKYFKAKERERDLVKVKEKEERKRKRVEDEDAAREEAEQEAKRIKREAELVERIKNAKRCERRLVPTLEKLTVEELLETNTYSRFNQSLEQVLDGVEDMDLNVDDDEDADVPQEALIPKYRLSELVAEAAKLKALGAMESVTSDRLVRVLSLLEMNVRDGSHITPLAEPDDDEDGSRLWMDITMERVSRAADASLVIMYVLTSAGMPKRVYMEDCIDRVMKFINFQLLNTVYPAFDPVYRISSNKKNDRSSSSRKKRAHAKDVRDKSILSLYNKLRELVSMTAELLQIQVLTDTTVLQISTLGVAPFFVENISDLQLSALKLVTTVFSKYPKHRRLLLDDILASIARLPSSKRSLRTYKLSAVGHSASSSAPADEPDVYIQMLTALVMLLIQCVVTLPKYLATSGNRGAAKRPPGDEDEPEPEAEVDRDVLITDRYDTAMRTAHSFLSVFLQKCGSKTEEIDYRPLFENFIQDLLAAVNKPEWPAAECLLSLLGNMLVSNFSNKGTEMALRVSSLDYLGVVAARLRRDAVISTARPELVDSIIAEVRREELRAGGGTGDPPADVAEVTPRKKDKKKKKKHDSSADPETPVAGTVSDPEEERTRFLQRILLDYLAVSAERDPALLQCRHFYLAQWYREAPQEIGRARQTPSKASRRKHKRKRRRHQRAGSHSSDEPSDSESDGAGENNDEAKREVNALVEQRRQFLLTKVGAFGESDSRSGIRSLLTYLDYDHAELICKYLASKRSFSHSFDVYLKQIIHVLSENAIAVRTKAMKCLTMVVEVDPAVLGRTEMQIGVHNSFLDHSTSVREAAVDLVGKFILSRTDLIEKYYSMLSARIMDTGVSVRKRVIKIMKDICVECPEFPKVPEICVKMIRRINDEEGIRKLVMDVFQAMWFTPVKERSDAEGSALLTKVMNITDVVVACQDSGLDWFEQLLNTLFKPKEDKEDSTKVVFEPPASLVQASRQIVDCLVQHILRIEESHLESRATTCGGEVSAGAVSKGSSQRLVACLTTLFMFARIRPKLLVPHAITLQPYLAVKCQTRGDNLIISNVARTLQLVVPLIEHPSETFLAQLEEDSVKLILQHEKVVVASCIACLGSIVNRVTKNFGLIRDCFRKYYNNLKWYKQKYEVDQSDPVLLKSKSYFRRSLFTVGLLLRHFDFKQPDVYKDLGEGTVTEVYELLMFFLDQPAEDVRLFTLQALGFLAIRHYELMLNERTKRLYHDLLQTADVNKQIKAQVLVNLETYLVEEEQRMIKQDEEWAKRAKEENLKEMGDVTSGMASTVIQLYLKRVLESFLDNTVTVRHAALKVIQLILAQGLVHPVQIVPYLICMSTDPDERISHTADKQLQEIEKKYPGFIQMKASAGIRLSYQLQQIIQPQDEPTRGLRFRDNEPPGGLNGFLYSIMRSTKQQRRAIAISCLRNFDEHVKNTLGFLLYLADNLACFPYQVADEVLFIIHQVDVLVSVTGSTVLQTVRELLLPPAGQVARYHLGTGALLAYDDEDEEDGDQILERMPEDVVPIHEALAVSEACNLLLVMKQHLKDFYGITDNKIAQYSPSDSGKVYEKSLNRRSNAPFRPKVTLQTLKQRRGASPPDPNSDEARAKLATNYLNFKQLMLHIDPDDDDDGPPVGASSTALPGGGVSTPSTGVYKTRSAHTPQQPPPGTPPSAARSTHLPSTQIPPSTASSGVAEPRQPPAAVPTPPAKQQPSRPPITLSLGSLSKAAAAAAASGQSAASRQLPPPPSSVPAEDQTETPRVPKLTIIPLRFPTDELRHHKHKHKKSDKHKKKKKKRKRRESDGDDADSDGASDPDFTV